MVLARSPGWLALALGLAACARGAGPGAEAPRAAPAATDMRVDTGVRDSTALPPVPPVRGPLAIRVVHPPPDAEVYARDSTFLLGSVGTGDARLTINGAPVRVWPNGAWLAWVSFPPSITVNFRIEARTATDSAVLNYVVGRGGWEPDRAGKLWVTPVSPKGRAWWPADEYLTLTARASEDAEVRLRLPDGTIIPMRPDSQLEKIPEGVRAFDRRPNLASTVRRDRYVAVIRGRALGLSLDPVIVDQPEWRIDDLFPHLQPSDTSNTVVVEAIRDGDTVRAHWPLNVALLDTLPIVAELRDDSTGMAGADTTIVGRAVPNGTYQWFFPNGTRARVSGRLNRELRLRLSPESEAWVDAFDARSIDAVNAAPAIVGSVRLTPHTDRVRLRIPVTQRVPYQVSETDRTLTVRLYGALGDVNWIQYGAADDPLIRRLVWSQDRREEVTLTIELSSTVWGYSAVWEHNDLVLDVRRPPKLDPGGSLKGRYIAVDPGHPPAGSTGPTGLREAEANLGIGLALKRLLEQEGARVFITRTEDVPIELWPRVDAAQRSGAELLVSIHNNALPDGVNPLTNSGASVYYNHPRSVPLARAVQGALVRRLGVRDLGIGRGDLALVRTTWMPSVLTEGLFMIVPEQEAALRSPEGQLLYAEAVVDGIRRFLRERALES